jgi:hypothetical protein
VVTERTIRPRLGEGEGWLLSDPRRGEWILMDPDRWQRIEALLDGGARSPAAERARVSPAGMPR